jgi:hypothetical protein
MSDESGRTAQKTSSALSPTRPGDPRDEPSTGRDDHVGGDPAPGGTVERAAGRDAPPRRLLPSIGTLIRLIALLVVVAIVAAGISFASGWRPSLNPFKAQKIDRSSPAVLRSLEDLSEYHAASAHMEVVVDVEDNTKWIPSALKGERVLFVGVGTVDSVVDFGKLGKDAVTVSADRRSATIHLPAPTLSEPKIDPKKSYVVARQRGALDRIGGLFGGQSQDQQLYVNATKRMGDAAAADGQVVALARQNTTAMLRGLLGALGFTNVTVTYDEDKR